MRRELVLGQIPERAYRDAMVLDGPHLNLSRDAGRELLRRACDQVVAEPGEPLLVIA